MNAAGTNWLHENRLHEIISIVVYPFLEAWRWGHQNWSNLYQSIYPVLILTFVD
jgi:hypothetical protein